MSNWTEALPIGNGLLGAMVFGGIERERIQLNEDTLWAGGLAISPPVVFAGHYAQAQRLASQKMRPPVTKIRAMASPWFNPQH